MKNTFATAGAFDRLPLADLKSEFDVVRQASLALFRNLPADAWGQPRHRQQRRDHRAGTGVHRRRPCAASWGDSEEAVGAVMRRYFC